MYIPFQDESRPVHDAVFLGRRYSVPCHDQAFVECTSGTEGILELSVIQFNFLNSNNISLFSGQSTNPTVIQTHLKKLFAGIHTVLFDDDNQHILAMKSVDGEVVWLKTPVKIQAEVEVKKIFISNYNCTIA